MESGALKTNSKSRESKYWFISKTDSSGLLQHLAQGWTEPDAVSSNMTRYGDASIKWALKERAGNFKRICISNLNFVQALSSLKQNDLLSVFCHGSLTCNSLFFRCYLKTLTDNEFSINILEEIRLILLLLWCWTLHAVPTILSQKKK